MITTITVVDDPTTLAIVDENTTICVVDATTVVEVTTSVETIVNIGLSGDGAAIPSNLSAGTRTATTFPIDNSYGDGVTVPQATTSYAGLLNASDKVAIDGFPASIAAKEPAITATGVVGQYWGGDKAFHTLDKTAVGLVNVDNTSDANKPISTATQTALDGKQPLTAALTNTTASFTTALESKLDGIATGATANSSDATLLARANHTGTQLASTISDFNTAADARVVAGITGKENTITAGTTSQYWRGDKSFQTLDKTAVGLANVDNTSDANKPISIAGMAAHSTGVKTGGVLSIGTGGAGVATTFTIASGVGMVVDNTTIPATLINVSWAAQTNVAVTNIATHPLTFIALNSSGTVIQQATDFSGTDHRQYIVIGIVVHTNLTTVTAVNQAQHLSISPQSQLNDLLQSLAGFNISGNLFSANGANLNINKTVGEIFKQGANYSTSANNPNIVTTASLTAATFRYNNQTGAASGIVSAIDPDNYDLAGVTTAVPVNKFTVQRIFLFSSNLLAVQRGQSVYNSLAEAKAAIQTESFLVNSSIVPNGILRAFLVVREGATALNSTTDAFFLEAPKFGGTAGVGGLSVSTMQNTYDNSSPPEILTIDGEVILRRGSAADTDNVIAVQDNAGTTNFAVTGEGIIVGGGNDGIRVASDGRLYGTALHNNAGAVTGATNQYIASGTYTPTLTNVTNVAASTARLCTWSRNGNKVTVSGQLDITLTTTLLASELDISLPIPSAFTTAYQLGGTATAIAAQASWGIQADATNDRAQFMATGIVSVTNQTYTFQFGYEIL